MNGIDWDALREEYVNGSLTYEELSQKHGLTRWKVERRGKEEGWTGRRRAHIEEDTDWASIREEYVNGSLTYKELGQKHGLPWHSIMHRGYEEGWTDRRRARIDAEIDWASIREDYIREGMSYRKLAEKYGIDRERLTKRAREEGWPTQRMMQVPAETQPAQTGPEEPLMSREWAERLLASAGLLLEKVNQLLQLEDALAPRDVKSISSTLLDLKAILEISLRSADAQEQRLDVVFASDEASAWAQ